MSASTSAIESVLVENRVFHPSDALVKASRISGMASYNALCAEAEQDFEGFWARLARENVSWIKPFTRTLDESNAPFYKWFDDAELNASANCLDKHMGTPNEHKTAVIFEADDGTVTKTSYRELLARVSQFANALKAHGVNKGDRVLVYMPMTLEGVIAMQACARVGATHSVVFGGFSAKALQERIIDAGAVARNCHLKPLWMRVWVWAAASPSKTSLSTKERPRPAIWSPGATRPSHRPWPARAPTARRWPWTRSIRCSSSTPPAPPASPRACSTPPLAICCGPS